MKELSIEEKAKAYDEAIKYGQYLINERCKEGTDGSFHCSDLQKMFPELKESEDERIRKAIIKMIADIAGGFPFEKYGILKKDALAWLEKQGEQKPTDKVEPKKEDTSELTPFEAELFSMMSDAWQGYQLGEEVNIAEIVKEHSSELLERANKQKPADWFQELEDKLANATPEQLAEWKEKYFKEEPAWSEEDEELLNTIINHFKVNVECTDDDDIIKWLKSLKDRVQPKPKQEWSEEDEKIFNQLKEILNIVDAELCKKLNGEAVPIGEAEFNYLKFGIAHCLSWLELRVKSLRPQTTWKPSEEQLNALHWCVMNVGSTEHQVLQELLEQLEKLKG